MPREFRRDPSPTHRTSYHFNPSAPSGDRRLSHTLGSLFGSLLVTGLLAGAAVGMIEPAQGHTPVPRSCADCRFIRSESGFLTCIERCLAGDVWCGEDGMTRARWEGWKFNNARTVARRESENDFDALFGERRRGVLEAKLHNGTPAVAFVIPELVFPLHDPTVTVKVEGEKTRTYRGERWSDEILIVTDPSLIRAFGRGCRVRVSTVPFGHERVDLQFDLAGFRDAADVVFGGKAP